jgi:3-oxoacyl-[acyl-carrier protein] reductase
MTAPHRRALVTGGSRGIGAAIVQALQDDGVEVVAPLRGEMDLSDTASIQGYLAGGPAFDILVNNAGINVLNEMGKIESDDWARMIQVNLTAPLELIQGVSPGMRERGWGRIVNVSSIFSLVTREWRGAYSAVKSGLNVLTRTAAVELAPYGVTVNAVCPGYVETDLTRKNNTPEQIAQIAQTIPARRLAQPAEIARLVAFLCGEENTYLTGQTVVADGGFTCR